MRALSPCLLALLLWTAACSGENPGVIVSIELWPGGARELRVHATLNELSADLEPIHPDQTGFVVRVEQSQRGELVLDATVLDGDLCKLATGQVRVTLGGALHPTQERLLRLTLLPTPMCTVTVQIDEGAGSVVSMPPGITGSGAGKFAADFERGTPVVVLPTFSAQTDYVLWSGDCRGSTDCVVVADRPRQVLAVFAPQICNKDHFCWQNPLPQGNLLRAVWQDPTGPAWAVGQQGTVLRCSGYSCAAIPTNTNQTLWGVAARQNEAIWIVGDNGTLLKCSESTRSCSSVSAGTAASLYDVWISGTDAVFAVGAKGTLTTCKAGQSGCTSTQLATARDLNLVWGRNTGAGTGVSLWVAGDGGTVFQGDGAAPWKQLPTNTQFNLYGIAGDDSGRVTIVGNAGTILTCLETPAPSCMALPPLPGVEDLSSVWQRATGEFWAVGALGTVLSCPPPSPGAACSLIPMTGVDYLWDVSETSSGDIIIVGDNGTVFQCRDKRCTLLASGLSSSLLSLSVPAKDELWAVGDGGAMLKCSGGACRALSSSAGEAPLSQMRITSPNEAWAVGNSGSVVRCTGSGCDPIASGTLRSLTGLWGNGKLIWTVGQLGTLLRCFGRTCTEFDSTVASSFSGIWGDTEQIFAVGGPVGVLCDKNGSCSGALAPDPPVEQLAVWGSRDHLWVVADQGAMLHYERSARELPTEVPPGVKTQKPLRSVWVNTQGVAWAAGDAGAVVKCTPGTPDTCTPIMSGVSEDLVKVRGDPQETAWVLGSLGTVLKCSGSACSPVSTQAGGATADVWFNTNGTAWIVAAAGVLECRSGVATCSLLGTGARLTSISGTMTNTGETDLWVAGDNGAILRRFAPE